MLIWRNNHKNHALKPIWPFAQTSRIFCNNSMFLFSVFWDEKTEDHILALVWESWYCPKIFHQLQWLQLPWKIHSTGICYEQDRQRDRHQNRAINTLKEWRSDFLEKKQCLVAWQRVRELLRIQCEVKEHRWLLLGFVWY